MRVINLKDNPDYYDLIKNLRKVVVFRMSEEFTVGDAENLRIRLQEQEYFEEYANVNLQGQRIYFLGKENPGHSILMIPAEDEYYIADIVGQINFWSLHKLMRSFGDDSSGTSEDFLDVFSLMGIKRSQDHIVVDSVSVDSFLPDTDPGLINKD